MFSKYLFENYNIFIFTAKEFPENTFFYRHIHMFFVYFFFNFNSFIRKASCKMYCHSKSTRSEEQNENSFLN